MTRLVVLMQVYIGIPPTLHAYLGAVDLDKILKIVVVAPGIPLLQYAFTHVMVIGMKIIKYA